MTTAERLRQRRLAYGKAAGFEQGYSQSQLAEAAGVTQGAYCAYEAAGRYARRVPLARMLRICAFYRVPLKEAFPEYRPTPAEREQLLSLREFAGV